MSGDFLISDAAEDERFRRIEAAQTPPAPPPPTALPAKRCKCEEPWLERDADGFAHCVRCGVDV